MSATLAPPKRPEVFVQGQFIIPRWVEDPRGKLVRVERILATGEVEKVDYNKEFSTTYDVTKLTQKPAPGKAGIEAFFTSKGNDLYAILPRWPGRHVEVKNVAGVKAVVLLGSSTPVKFQVSKGGIAIEMPDVPDDLMSQPAWVLKVQR